MTDTTIQTTDARAFDPTSSRIDHAIVMVDAAIARRWLTRHVTNRNISQTAVAKYRRDMIAGRWVFAADPIRFDVDGHLQDGRHRLTALAEVENLTLPMMVVRGLPVAAQGAMDQGRKRTPGQQLELRGIKNYNNVAAAVKQYIVWDEGLLFRDNKLAQQITSAQIESWVVEHPEDVAFYQDIINLTKQCDAPPSVTGAVAIALGRISQEKAREFFTLLAQGAGTAGHPIVTLDKRLQRIRREGLSMPRRDYLAFFIQAWNAWRAGRQMAKFQRPRGGSWDEENFPVPS